MIPAKSLESLSPCLVDCHGNPLLRNRETDSPALDGYLSEEELLDEADVSILPQEVQHLGSLPSLPRGFNVRALVLTEYALLFWRSTRCGVFKEEGCCLIQAMHVPAGVLNPHFSASPFSLLGSGDCD